MQRRPATYTMQAASIRQETTEAVVIGPATLAWLNPILGGGLFAFLAVILFWGGRDFFLFGVIMLSLAVFYASHSPLAVGIIFDLTTQQVRFSATYLLRRPRRVQIQASFSQIAKLDFRPTRWGKKHTVEAIFVDGVKTALEFGQRTTDAERLVGRFAALAGTPSAPMLNSPIAIQDAMAAESQSRMEQQLRSWSVWLLIMGVAQMVAAQGFSSWGALLIVVGLASYYFREAPMFVVYAVTVAWAGLSNLLYGESLWKGFALLQGYWAYSLFQQFRRFRQVEQVASSLHDTHGVLSRSARLFPWLAITLGVGALAAFVITFVGVWANVFFLHNRTLSTILRWLEPLAVYSGILALATGLAASVAGYPSRWASIAGCVGGALTMAAEVGLGLLLNS